MSLSSVWSKSSRSIRSTLVVTCMGLLAGCVTGAGSSKPAAGDEDAGLEQRALARWQLLIAGKPGEAYDYLTPGYRSTRTREDYVNLMGSRSGIRWTEVLWNGDECPSENNCLVKIYGKYTVKLPQAGDVAGFDVLEERWIRSEGKWYHLPVEK